MSFFENLKNLDSNIDTLVKEYLDLQIACILLYYAADRQIRQGNVHNGKVISGFAEYMRNAINELRNNYEQSLGKEELEEVFTRIARNKIFYSSLSDAAIEVCKDYFVIAPRPSGQEFTCNEAACDRNMDIQLRKYFDSTQETA